jgi:hypothetical protein
MGNMEKQRAPGWTNLQGEVTAAKLHPAAGCCSSSLAMLLLDTHIMLTFYVSKVTKQDAQPAFLLAIWLSGGMIVKCKRNNS